MDLTIHNGILLYACAEASRRLNGRGIADPLAYFPLLVRGSWMTDMNQSTLFTDMIPKAADKDANIQTELRLSEFFQTVWAAELSHLLEEMSDDGNTVVQKAAADFKKKFPENKPGVYYNDQASAIPGFGIYSRFDHLDVLVNNTEVDYGGWPPKQDCVVSATIRNTRNTIAGRLVASTFNKEKDERLNPENLTDLGRALHTFGDFYAHSNHIELLLWSLAQSRKLSSWILDEFNRKDEFFTDMGRNLLYCPLPVDDPSRELIKKDSMFWYGNEPKQTPLGSCLFDTRDTAFSLMKMYAAHLERVDGGLNDDTFNLALAVFDIPGRVPLGKLWKCYTEARGLLERIGMAARSFLADQLIALGRKSGGTAQGMSEACAGIIKNYASKEVGEWARAGRLRYIAYTLQNDMARELEDQSKDNPVQPHHSLLCKDNLPCVSRDIMRFNLACLFAAEGTARLIEMHFSPKKSSLTDYGAIADKYLIHPWMQVTNDSLMNKSNLNAWLERSFIGGWPSLFDGNRPVIQ